MLYQLLAIFALLGSASATDQPKCSMVCSKGKPCGNACIREGDTCHKTHGSACSIRSRCSAICFKGKPCGDACIAEGDTCHKPHGRACWGNGLRDA